MDNTQNNSEQDFEDVAGADDGIPEEGEVVKTPLKFTPEIIERDARQIDVVEINFKDATAQVVQDSDAPKLTKKVLKEKGAPIQVGKTTFDGAAMEVDMYHGVGLTLELLRQQVFDAYKDRNLEDLTTFVERDLEVKRLLLSGLIPDTFSYQGNPVDLPPIEEITDILLNALWDAYVDLHFPLEDDIYQIRVVRGVPLDVNQMLQNTFEIYPVGGKVDTEGMPDDEMEMFVERSDAQRSVLVSSMILSPNLSVNGEGSGKNPYPVEKLSEWFMQCLHAGYRASNVPVGGQAALSRFLRQFTDRKRT